MKSFMLQMMTGINVLTLCIVRSNHSLKWLLNRQSLVRRTIFDSNVSIGDIDSEYSLTTREDEKKNEK